MVSVTRSIITRGAIMMVATAACILAKIGVRKSMKKVMMLKKNTLPSSLEERIESANLNVVLSTTIANSLSVVVLIVIWIMLFACRLTIAFSKTQESLNMRP